MRLALQLAQQAADVGEVPVGAVVVLENEVIGEGFNSPITLHDPSAHAEIQAIRAAAARLQNYRLSGCQLYVTIEPCAMCFGAMIHARVAQLIYGAPEPRAGAVHSALQLADENKVFNHKVDAVGGVLAEPCANLMRGFFKQRR